jgi:signal transduction histidine kinase
MKLKKSNKVSLSIFTLLLFFSINIFFTYQTFFRATTDTQSVFLQIAVSSIFYILAIITFIQYLFFKEPTYFYYVLYLHTNLAYFSVIFSYICGSEEIYNIFFREIRDYLSLPLLMLSYCIYAYFMIGFLSLKIKDSFSFKWANAISKIYLVLFLLTIISYLILPTGIIGDVVRTVLLVCCMPIGIIGITIIYKRIKNIIAIILCIGTSFLYIGSVMGFLFSFKILNTPFKTFPFNRWIFYTEMGAALEAIMFFSSFAYRNKILTDEEQFAQQKIQNIRDDIARDLHDDIGASLSNINILNELAKRNAGNAFKANEYLNKAGEDIQHINEGLHDIVWNINPKYDDLNNLFIRMKRYAADMMDGKNICYEIIFPEKISDIKLDMNKRKDLYYIFKEAINNLIKYSCATNAKIILTIQHNKLLLRISDDGKGFDLNNTVLGNGLENMQHRAGSLHALLKIESEPDHGTNILLSMNIV